MKLKLRVLVPFCPFSYLISNRGLTVWALKLCCWLFFYFHVNLVWSRLAFFWSSFLCGISPTLSHYFFFWLLLHYVTDMNFIDFSSIGEFWEKHQKEKVPLQIVLKNLGLDMMILSVFQLEVIDLYIYITS